MSKKDYIRVAAILKRQVDIAEQHEGDVPVAVEEIASELASFFAEDNPNFDRSRFLAACGVTA